jgi:hypothetical protein
LCGREVRRNQVNQPRPGNDLVHLHKKECFASLAKRHKKPRGGLQLLDFILFLLRQVDHIQLRLKNDFFKKSRGAYADYSEKQ